MLPVYTTHTWGLGISVGVCGRAGLAFEGYVVLFVDGGGAVIFLFLSVSLFLFLLHAMLAFGAIY